MTFSILPIRDMREYKSRVESYSREMLRKESQIKELQGRIESGDGCKYFLVCFFGLSPLSVVLLHYIIFTV